MGFKLVMTYSNFHPLRSLLHHVTYVYAESVVASSNNDEIDDDFYQKTNTRIGTKRN